MESKFGCKQFEGGAKFECVDFELLSRGGINNDRSLNKAVTYTVDVKTITPVADVGRKNTGEW